MSQEKESIQEEKHSQSKEYRCFCAKNYNSYAGLYLHLKSKHQDAFSQYKNMKISKLLTPLESEPSKLVFKLKEPSKQQNQGNQSSSQKLAHLNGPSLAEQERKALNREQPFYLYRPQGSPYTPINYYPPMQPQTYMIPSQTYLPNPVRQFAVSSQPMGYYLDRPNNYYQYPVAIQQPQQQVMFSYPPQTISNPYFANNGLQYWVGTPFSQPAPVYRPLVSQQPLKCPENEQLAPNRAPGDRIEKQKSRAQQKKVKPQSKNNHNSSEQSTKKSIEKGEKTLSSQKTKLSETIQP